MRVLKINAEERKIEAVEIRPGNLQDIYDVIGNGCSVFECPFCFDNGDTLYVDEEGLSHEIKGGYAFPGWSYPMVGNGIIIGTDHANEGESTDALSLIEEIEAQIIWVDKEQWVK